MTLNIFFFSITIKKRQMSMEEAKQQELAEKFYNENKDRQIAMYRLF